MKKKILSVILTGVMLASLVACGKTPAENKDTRTEKEETVTTVVEEETQEKKEEASSEEGTEAIEEENTVVDLSDISLNINLTGEKNDYCLEYRDMFVDFGPANDVYDNVRIEKRSESNVVLYFNENTDQDYSVQYSSMPGKFSDEKQRDVIFKNGYETAETSDGYKVLYTFEKEEKGTRAIIMQELANDHYASIRSFNDIGMNNADFVKAIVINKNYPIFSEQ